MQGKGQSPVKHQLTPPYLPFSSFLTALDRLAQAMPTQITRDVFTASGLLKGQYSRSEHKLYATLLRLRNTSSESVPDYTQWVQGIAAEALALVDGDDPADICRDCGHSPATGACFRCKMD